MVWVCPKCGFINTEEEDEESGDSFGTFAFPRCRMCGEPRWYSTRRW